MVLTHVQVVQYARGGEFVLLPSANMIRWFVWPMCCSEAPREHSRHIPLACKVGALEQVEPLSGVCDIVFLWFLNVFCGCVVPRVGSVRLD